MKVLYFTSDVVGRPLTGAAFFIAFCSQVQRGAFVSSSHASPFFVVAGALFDRIYRQPALRAATPVLPLPAKNHGQPRPVLVCVRIARSSRSTGFCVGWIECPPSVHSTAKRCNGSRPGCEQSGHCLPPVSVRRTASKPGLFFSSRLSKSRYPFPAVQFKLRHNVQGRFPALAKPLTASPSGNSGLLLVRKRRLSAFWFLPVYFFARRGNIHAAGRSCSCPALPAPAPRLVPGCARFAPFYQYNAKFCNVKPASQSVPGSGFAHSFFRKFGFTHTAQGENKLCPVFQPDSRRATCCQVIVPKGQRSVRLQNSFCFPKGAGHKVVIFLLVPEGVPLGLLDEIWWVNKTMSTVSVCTPSSSLKLSPCRKLSGRIAPKSYR